MTGRALLAGYAADLALGDPGRLGQVLANLGSNAVKFTSEGEVAIHAVVEDADADRVRLRIDVTDTGVGIEPDQLPLLFEAFTQADPSTTRQHGGTGLGLAISQQLVQALGVLARHVAHDIDEAVALEVAALVGESAHHLFLGRDRLEVEPLHAPPSGGARWRLPNSAGGNPQG